MNELLRVSGAVYDETRIAILGFLLKHGECCVCELVASLSLGQSRISRHLGLLQDAGLIVANRHGKWVYYSIISETNELKRAIFNSISYMNIQLPEKIDACKIEKGKKMKNILILCTGNSCRSIMGEALANHYLGELGVKAYSSGVQPSGQVNPYAIKALQKEGIPTDELSSKTMDKLPIQEFDLVVTVCDHANETCPMFAGNTKKIHVGFEDPSGGAEEGYTASLHEIKDTLLPKIKEALGV